MSRLGRLPWTRILSSYRFGLLLVALVVIGTHSAALHDTRFTFDDHDMVEHNPALIVDSFGDVSALVSGSYWPARFAYPHEWRPVTLLSLALDRTLLGPGPDGFHRVNVFLHLLATGAVFVLLRRVLRAPRAALFGAVFFALHPVHAESTAGVVGRAEVLALTFAVLGWLLHLRARDRGSSGLVVAAGASFFVGFCAKETALTAPFVLVAVEFALRSGRGARRGWLIGPYLYYVAMVLLYFACRWVVLGPVAPRANVTVAGLSLGERVLLAAGLARDSWGALLIPQGTAAGYPTPDASASSPLVWVTVGVHLVALLFALWALSRPRRASRLVGVGILGSYLAMGPMLNIIPVGMLRHDRHLYSPSVFACLLVAACFLVAWRRLPSGALRRATWPVVALILFMPSSLRLADNIRAWTDDLRLWTATLERNPGDVQYALLAGEVLMSRGEYDRALPYVQQAAAGGPVATRARARLGTILIAAGRIDEALAALERADPEDPAVLQSKARAHQARARALSGAARERELSKAEGFVHAALAQRPEGSYELQRLLGQLRGADAAQRERALEAFDAAVAMSPTAWPALLDRAGLLTELGRPADALRDLEVAIEALTRESSQTRAARDMLPRARELQELLRNH